MLNTDEDALICDLAETYHIFNYKGLSLQMVATFCVGLRNDSRIKMKLSNMEYSIETLLLGMMADSLNFIAWSKTEAAQRNENRPQSIYNMLMGIVDVKSVDSFASGKDFENMRMKILKDNDTWQQN